MRRLNCWMCAVAALALAGVVMAGQANGQWNKQGAQKPENAVDVKADGTLKGLSPAVAQVLGGGGEQWLVKVPGPQQVVYNGMAEPGWLRPGMFVEFTGTFDAKGHTVSPLTQVSVFTPTKERPLGAQADSGLSTAAANLFQAEEPQEKKQPEQQTVSLKVAGRIVGLRDGKLSVAAGNANVTAELAEKCSVYISVYDASLARPDDTVAINGWRLPNDQTHIYATRLTINGKEPLTTKRPAADKSAAKPVVKADNVNPEPAKETTTVSKEAREAALAELEDPSAGD